MHNHHGIFFNEAQFWFGLHDEINQSHAQNTLQFFIIIYYGDVVVGIADLYFD